MYLIVKLLSFLDKMMGKVFGTTCLIIGLSTQFLYGLDEAKLEKFKQSRSCEYCDLTGAVFDGMDLQGANLQNAKLEDATFRNVDMAPRQMEKTIHFTNLENGNFRSVNFTGAVLVRATLVGGYFRDADFSAANLENADMRDGNFKKASFIGTNLLGASLKDANFDKAVFCKTVMPDGVVNNANC